MEVKSLIDQWMKEEETLAHLFKQRENYKALPLMEHYTKKCKQAICLINDFEYETEANFQQMLPHFAYKPFNVEERLAFITHAPSHYHSFIQLKELFRESAKLHAKVSIIKKRG
ncbi:YpoC family protein [Pontibacillus litoralis]|uniref:YpoC-like domain-containing protein n=1 Tax=Pontibacillus litoralis JSM 072002 TaxID=1385512 RepID=A0A0A5G7N7_9BACI|nr:hypothetical protein [Pontibacillus litoralis]KGX88024.1 hypothetical protein N784_12600 [Pontibacillus litoralis JSM 072002]